MPTDGEPSENIAGGTERAERDQPFQPGEAETSAEAVVDRLGQRYWQKSPADRCSNSRPQPWLVIDSATSYPGKFMLF